MSVSVIIPAYDAAAFIEVAIASAQRQSQPPLEIIVIDDCSRDQTAELVRSAMRSDPSIKLFRTPRNAGPGAARNLGLAEARGEWIALLDADDAFDPDRLECLTVLGRQGNADLVSDNMLIWGGNASATRYPMFAPDDLPSTPFTLTTAAFIAGCTGNRRQPRKSLGFMQPLISTAFLRRHAITYPEDMRFGEDFMIYLACLVAGATWTVTPRAMYQYRIRSGSLTERQAARDLLRLRAAVQDILVDPATRADRALATAALRYRTQIDRQYYYRAFTDAVKAHQRLIALRFLFANRSSIGHIVSGSVEQAPTIIRKALSGGYFIPPQRFQPAARNTLESPPAL